MPEALYNTTVRVIAQIRASSPEEARERLMASLGDVEILPMEAGDVFVSEPVDGWDGERFDDHA